MKQKLHLSLWIVFCLLGGNSSLQADQCKQGLTIASLKTWWQRRFPGQEIETKQANTQSIKVDVNLSHKLDIHESVDQKETDTSNTPKKGNSVSSSQEEEKNKEASSKKPDHDKDPIHAGISVNINDQWEIGDDVVKLRVALGIGKTVQLESAQLAFKEYTIGKIATNFSDSESCGLASGTFVQMRRKWQLSTDIHCVIATEDTFADTFHTSKGKKDNQVDTLQKSLLPTVTASVQYTPAVLPKLVTSTGRVVSLKHMGLSLLGRPLVQLEKQGGTSILITRGVSMGVSCHPFTEKITLKLQGIYGYGLGDYMSMLSADKNNAVCEQPQKSGETLRVLHAGGVGLVCTYQWAPQWKGTFSWKRVGMLSNLPRGKEAHKLGDDVSLGVAYQANKQTKLGFQVVGSHSVKGDSSKSKYTWCIKFTLGMNLIQDQEEV